MEEVKFDTEESNKFLELAKTLVGLTLEAAKAKVSELRVMGQDGESLLGTADFRPERYNVEVIDGVITKSWNG